jgi:type II secretory pathway component PulM
MAAAQQYSNHRRVIPVFHIGLGSLLVLNLFWTLRHVIKWPQFPRHWVELMMAVAFLLMFHYFRQFPKVVQDRVIRVEETLRYQRVLPADLQQRARELTLRQTIGLRFAGDDELAGLVRKALDEHLTEEQIKRQVQHWRADEQRC